MAKSTASKGVRLTTAVTTIWAGRFVASLYETRRKEADIELGRYRHLLGDADTVSHFVPGAVPKDRTRPFAPPAANEKYKMATLAGV